MGLKRKKPNKHVWTKPVCEEMKRMWSFVRGVNRTQCQYNGCLFCPTTKKNLTSTVSKILSGPVCLKHSLWHFSTLATITLVNCTAHILATWKCPLARRLQGLAKNILNTKLSPFAPWWNVFCLYFCSFFSFTFQKAGCKWSLNSNVFFIICSKD